MAQPAHSTYSVGAGLPIHGGRYPGGLLSGAVALADAIAAGLMAQSSQLSGGVVLDGVAPAGALGLLEMTNISNFANDAFVPTSTAGQPTMLYLHGSGTNSLQNGAFWSADMTGSLTGGITGDTHLYWAAYKAVDGGVTYTQIRPRDRHPDNNDGLSNLNSYHMGYVDGSGVMQLVTERRLDQLLAWTEQQYPQCSTTKRCMSGDSVGAWACMTYGIRRPAKFAALYPSRPKVRWDSSGPSHITLPSWPGVQQIQYDVTSSSPNKSATDGGGSMAAHMNITDYVANTANRIPWVGWVIGKNDGFMPWQDHLDFIAAMRAAKRGFAVSWNLGNHSTAPNITDITSSYYIGLLEVGVGYPLLTNNSGDSDPATVDVGGINLGFEWRNVVESAGGWSCEITNILGARTVTVEPISTIFTASATPQTINIPAANSWVSVSF